MATSLIAKNFRDATLTLKDGTGSPVSLAVPGLTGSISISGIRQGVSSTAGPQEVKAYLSRGRLHSLRKGAVTFPTISFEAILTELSDGTNTVVIDFALKDGAYTANVSTTAALGDVYTMDLVLTIEGSDFGAGEADHTLTLEDVQIDLDIEAMGDPSSIKFTGTVYGAVDFA